MTKSKFPWLKMAKKTVAEKPLEPPIWFGNHSNGEYFHKQTPHEFKVRAEILRKADENARRVGMDRREFMASAMGMATSLWVMNGCREADPSADAGAGMCSGGGYEVPEAAMYDENTALTRLSGNEFIFDVQTHHFDPQGEWVQTNPAYLSIVSDCGMTPKAECMSMERYQELMFCESDTTMAALSTWPAALCSDTRRRACGLPLPNAAVVTSQNLINMSANSQRLVNHVQLMPNDLGGLDAQLAIMEEMHECYGVAAWKLYPAWGPNGQGFWLDDDICRAVIEKGMELGVTLFCVHKGLPIPGFDVEHNYPTDVGRIAKLYPDCKFVIYHSAICAGQSGFCVAPNEGPYDPDNAERSVNSFIKSLQDNDVKPNSNVYAEMGSSYSQVMRNPVASQHYMGKLLKYVGENNVCWGTDAILSGSPQGLIETFRTLEISDEFQEQYGYPALTADLKAKVFGLNSAAAYGVKSEEIRYQLPSCPMTANKRLLDAEFGERRWTNREPLGPKTRREFFALAKEHDYLKVPG